MTSKERAALRSQANTLDAIIQIGKEGISDNLIKQIDDTLNCRELIKIRVHLETSPKTPKELANELATPLNAEVIQVIGGIIVLYREITEPKEKKQKAKKEPKKSKKKKVVKGLRQRQKEKEELHPYAASNYKAYKGNRNK